MTITYARHTKGQDSISEGTNLGCQYTTYLSAVTSDVPLTKLKLLIIVSEMLQNTPFFLYCQDLFFL